MSDCYRFATHFDYGHRFQITRNFINSESRDEFDRQTTVELNALNFSHPGIAHPVIETYDTQTVKMKYPGVKPQFAGFSVNFLVDKELKVYKYFYNWFKLYGNIKDIAEVTEIPTNDYLEYTLSVGHLFMLDDSTYQPAFHFEYLNMWPKGMSNLEFTSVNSDIKELILTVEFEIDTFNLVETT